MREEPVPHYKTAVNSDQTIGMRQLAAWTLAAIAVIVALTGAYFWGASNAEVTKVDILIPTPAPAVVHVSGEVRVPGVYTLDATHRVVDAIDAAGGTTVNANLENLNLASLVKDGARVYVPPGAPKQTALNGSIYGPGPIQAENGAYLTVASANDSIPLPVPEYPIDINTATLQQLESLPSIGETRAAQIIAFRTASGGISSIDQLLEIHGIGTKTLESIRPMLIVR